MRQRPLIVVFLLVFSIFAGLSVSSASAINDSGWYHSNIQIQTSSGLVNETITGVSSSTPIYLNPSVNGVDSYNNTTTSLTGAPFGPQIVYSNLSMDYFQNYTYYNESFVSGDNQAGGIAPSLNNSIFFNGKLIFWSQGYSDQVIGIGSDSEGKSSYNFNGTVSTYNNGTSPNDPSTQVAGGVYPRIQFYMNFTKGKLLLYVKGGGGTNGPYPTYLHSYNLTQNGTLCIRSYSYGVQIGMTSGPKTYWKFDNFISATLSTPHNVTFNVNGNNWTASLLGPAGFFTTTTGKISGITNGIYNWWISPGFFSPNNGTIDVNNQSVTLSINKSVNPSLTPKYYVPITLINSYDYYTPLNFTERISMDWQPFSAYLSQNLSNVRVYDSLAFIPQNELFGWIGSNDSYSSDSSVIYVNMLNDLIPAQSKTTIYLVFMQKNVSWSDYWGLSPILSKNYGQYDNGKQVFTNYFNALDPLSHFSTLYGENVARINSTYDGHPIALLSFSYSGAQFPYSEYTNQSFSLTYFTQGGFFYADSPSSTSNWLGSISSNNVISLYSLSSSTTQRAALQSSQIAEPTNIIVNSNTSPSGSPIPLGYYFSELDNYESNQVLGSMSTYPVSGGSVATLVSSVSLSTQKNMWISYNTMISFAFVSPDTPNNVMPTPTFGSIAVPIYPVSFTSYGLPSNASWTVAIGFGSGINVEQISSTSSVIFSYLPNGTYTFTIGSIQNNSYQSGFDQNLTPSPSGGQLIVTGSNTNQVVIWNKADLLLYNLIPGSVSLSKGRIILPIFVVNSNNIPANNSTIKQIWQNLKLTYVSVNNSNNAQIPFEFSSSGYGEFSIFVNLTKYQITNITNTNAIVSMVSPFNKTSGYTDLAVGSMGPTAFASSNLTAIVPPPTQKNPGFQLTRKEKIGIGVGVSIAVVVVMYLILGDRKKDKGGWL